MTAGVPLAGRKLSDVPVLTTMSPLRSNWPVMLQFIVPCVMNMLSILSAAPPVVVVTPALAFSKSA